MALDKVYDYFRSYDSKTYVLFAAGGTAPDELELQKYEEKFSLKFPDDLKELLVSPLSGMYFEVKEDVWPHAKQFDIGPMWSFMRGIVMFGVATETPEFMNLYTKTEELQELGFTEHIPFMYILGDDKNIYCFDKDEKIVIIDAFIGEEVERLDISFSECLMKEIEDLEARKNDKVQGKDKK